MLTYVINTSENKTFDSDRLFDLAGYHKIHWMNCSLSEIGECARTIHEKQNILGAPLSVAGSGHHPAHALAHLYPR